MSDNEKVIIARIQNRRGLKQDLPTPLRPGELGFASDSRQLYIGAETSDPLADAFNRKLEFENTLGARARTIELANTSIIRFTVPHKRFERGYFDGATKLVSWNVSGNTFVDSGEPVFANTITSGSNAASAIRSIDTNQAFAATDLTVTKSGELLVGDNANAVPSAAKDYVFSSGVSSSQSHVLTLKNAPLASESITVTYYSNTSVIDAIESTGQIFSRTPLEGFYETYPEIPTHRYFDNSLITVSPTTGVGYIGFKHNQTAVYVGGATSIATPNSLTLGNLLVSRNSDAVDASANVSGANIEITIGSHNYGAAANSEYPQTYITAPSDTYFNGKNFDVIATSNTTITVAMPTSQSFVTHRAVTATANANISSGNLITLRGNVEGMVAGDTVAFIDTAANASGLDGVVAVASNVGLAPGTDNGQFSVIAPNVTSVSANLFYVNRGNVAALGNNTHIQVYSEDHGHPVGGTVQFDEADFGNVQTVVAPVTENTFYVDTGNIIASQVSDDMRPYYDGESFAANVFTATPILAIDLSSATTLANAVAIVDALEDWPQLSFVPDQTDRVYFSHKPAYSSTGVEFRLYEDSEGTLDTLNLAEGLAGRNTTVKAKFERWLNTLLNSADVNLFASAQANEKFSNSGVSAIGTWNLDIDNTIGEITFDSRQEAGLFAKTINDLYYQTFNSDIRGLVNLKTNIEVITADQLTSGVSITTYDSPRTDTISNGVGVVADFTQDITLYNNFVLEYSIKDTNSTANVNYKRIGQLLITADSDQDAVTIQDISSEVSEGYTGNIEFTANISGDDVQLVSNNTLNPSSDVTFSYIMRRWKD